MRADWSRQILIIAKAPKPGRSKTRLVGVLSPEEAARVAEACLLDVLRVALAVRDTRVLLALEGEWVPLPDKCDWNRVRILAQRGDGLAERIEHALADARATANLPTLLLVPDSPQMRPGHVEELLDALEGGTAEAVIGRCPDGGYWALGMARVEPTVLRGVPMSTQHTAEAQMTRLRAAGMTIWTGAILRDVDDFESAVLVRAKCPKGEFAQVWDDILRSAASRFERYDAEQSPP